MKFIKSIAIVGGGSSGWSAAAYITNLLPQCKVTVVDKEMSTPIGVGEATILSFKPFMDACGFDHWDWLSNLDTTPKAGILYPDWIKKGNTIWHPFNTSATVINGTNQYEMWTHNKDLDFKRHAIASYDSAVVNNTVDSSAQSYHIDCIKFVKFVKERIKDNITHISSGVKQVLRDGKTITGLVLENDQTVTADLYVDCTGFKNLLTEAPVRNDVYGRLFCNSAVSCHVEYNDRHTEIKPYTTAIATELGWIWIIPTRARIGSGLVYDKNCVTEEQATEYLQNFWKDHAMSKVTKHNWDPYYKDAIWENNVVSIGLSAGFIEPLESTGLALIHLGITKLVDKIKHYYYSDLEASRYNLEMKTAFEDAIDFVSTHYSYTERTEPFWQHVKKHYKPSERLSTIITNHINSATLNTSFLYEDTKIFSPMNYALWLEQLGYTKINPINILPGFSEIDIRNYLIYFTECVQATTHTSYPNAITEVEKYERYAQSPFRPELIR
jgi:tryptophan 7-halogenase